MKPVSLLIAKLGDYLLSLSDRARIQIVVIGLILLGGGSIYKLVNSVEMMKKPLPSASPSELIKPMEQLVQQTSAQASRYNLSRQHGKQELDSLNKFYYKQARPK